MTTMKRSDVAGLLGFVALASALVWASSLLAEWLGPLVLLTVAVGFVKLASHWENSGT